MWLPRCSRRRLTRCWYIKAVVMRGYSAPSGFRCRLLSSFPRLGWQLRVWRWLIGKVLVGFGPGESEAAETDGEGMPETDISQICGKIRRQIQSNERMLKFPRPVRFRGMRMVWRWRRQAQVCFPNFAGTRFCLGFGPGWCGINRFFLGDDSSSVGSCPGAGVQGEGSTSSGLWVPILGEHEGETPTEGAEDGGLHQVAGPTGWNWQCGRRWSTRMPSW